MEFARRQLKFNLLPFLILVSLEAKDIPAPQPRLTILAKAAPTINRDPVGNPLSVVVRVYQLRDRQAFASLTFDAAASGRPEPEFLGTDCLGRTEFALLPGSSHRGTEDLLPGTRYLGVVALFRHPDPHHWRGLAKVEPPAPASAEETKKPSWLKRKLTRKKPGPAPPPWNPELAFEVEDCYLRVGGPTAEPLPDQSEPFAPRCAEEAPAPEPARKASR